MIEKETLSAKLTELGIKHDGRMTADKLFELLPEGEREAFVKPVAEAPLGDAVLNNVLNNEMTANYIPAEPAENKSINFANLSEADLRALKAMLNDVPLTSQNINERTATVRKWNGKYVVDSKPTRMLTVLDTVEQRAVAKHTLPIRYYGETVFVDVDYKEFMANAERVKCKIKNVRNVQGIIEEGVVFSQERKVDVPQVVNTLKSFYSVELPNGEIIELASEMVNF